MNKITRALVLLLILLIIPVMGLSEEDPLNQTGNETENETGNGINNETDPDLEPQISTGSALTLDYDVAMVIGLLEDLGGEEEVNVSFRYRREGEDWMSTVPRVMNSTANFSDDLMLLYPGTEYEFKAVVEWNGEESTGESNYFTTPKSPGLHVGPPSEVISDSAVLRANIGDWGEVELFFRYREPGGDWSETSPVGVSDSGVFERRVTGLEPDTTYEFGPIIGLNGRNIEGPLLNFTTLQASVRTFEATGVFSDSAILQGSSGNWNEAEVFFRYREPGGDWLSTPSQNLTGSDVFDEEITDLDPDTTYEFRSVVDWSDGEEVGEIISFTTYGPVEESLPGLYSLIFVVFVLCVGVVFVYLMYRSF